MIAKSAIALLHGWFWQWSVFWGTASPVVVVSDVSERMT
jgi:hypothetical protein